MQNETIQTLEIGSLIEAITGQGFRVEIMRLFPFAISGNIFGVSIQSEELRDSPAENSRFVKGETIVEALTKAANVARYINRKPPLAKPRQIGTCPHCGNPYLAAE